MMGLPGAGKTQVRRGWDDGAGVLTINRLVERERIRAAERHRRGALARALPDVLKVKLLRGSVPDARDLAWFTVRHPDMLTLVWERTGLIGDLSEREVALGLVFDAWSAHGFAERTGVEGESVLLDEGFWQRYAYILALTGDAMAQQVVLPAPIPPLDGVVLLDVPLERAGERVLGRERGFADVDLLPAMGSMLERLVVQLRAQGVRVEVVDADRSPPQVRADVRRVVEGWTRSATRR